MAAHTLLQTLQGPASVGLRIVHANDIHARWGGQLSCNAFKLGGRPSCQSCMMLRDCNPPEHTVAWIVRRIEPSDANFNLASPDKYNGSYGGLPRMAGYIARARTEAAAAQQDILVLHAGVLWRGQSSYGPAGRLAGRRGLCSPAHLVPPIWCPPLLTPLLPTASLCAPCNVALPFPAGDQYTGTAWDSIYTQKGNYSVAELLNMMQFDAMVRALADMCSRLACAEQLSTLPGLAAMVHMQSMFVAVSLSTQSLQAIGNHEFDFGPANLAGFAGVLTTPLIR